MRAASLRQSQKEATRLRVLAAARDLFETIGFEETTVRQIARQAEVSVGSVFTTFRSKAEILSAVMADRLEALYGELDRVVPRLRGSTADRLRSMFAIHFAFEAPHVRLFLAHIAAAYSWALPENAQPYGRNLRLQALVRHCLQTGVESGEVDPGVDLQAVIDLLMSAYAWTYRLAAWERAPAEQLTEVMDRQIGLIAEGFRPR